MMMKNDIYTMDEIYMLKDQSTGVLRFFASAEVAYADLVQRAASAGKDVDINAIHKYLANNLIRFIRADARQRGGGAR